MGHRTLKRVPLDFQWPIDKVWEGYINPHYRECKECDGKGLTYARQHLENLVHLILVAGECSTRGESHPWLNVGCAPSEPPSKDMMELTTGLAGRKPSFIGHDSLDRWTAVDKIIKAAGLNPKQWGVCLNCKGEGVDPKVRRKYKRWKEYEPPTGGGYQLWETTTEGSPVSPVCGTTEELATWCEKNASIFGGQKVSKSEWLKMFTKKDGVDNGSTMIVVEPTN